MPVPKTAGPARRSCLALCRLSAVTLKLSLGLLGIPSLEWMGGGVGLGKFRLPFFRAEAKNQPPNAGSLAS